MLGGPNGAGKANTLMGEYSVRLGEAILRSRMRAAEQNARIEREIAARVKSEFISNMSHELRTPLNTMIGFSKLLAEHDRRTLKPAEITEYGRLIQDAAAHLLSLINDILDISKLQSGRYQLNTEDVAIEEILESTVASFKKAAQASAVAVKLEIKGVMPATQGDGQKIRQAIGNLVSNAIKFSI